MVTQHIQIYKRNMAGSCSLSSLSSLNTHGKLKQVAEFSALNINGRIVNNYRYADGMFQCFTTKWFLMV